MSKKLISFMGELKDLLGKYGANIECDPDGFVYLDDEKENVRLTGVLHSGSEVFERLVK